MRFNSPTLTCGAMMILALNVAAQRLGAKLGDPEEYREIPLAAAKSRGLLPRSVDLAQYFPSPGNQGEQGSCVGWATAYALKGYLEKRERNWQGDRDDQLFSPSYIYNQINGGEDKGSDIAEALDLLMREGVATLKDFPYDPYDFKTQPAPRVKAQAGQYAIASFRRINQSELTSQVRNHLADGFPVIIAMMVGEKFMAHRGGTSFSAPDSDGTEGGHAMCTVGYDDARRAFKIINSWGKGWGDGGYGWITYDTFSNKVKRAFVVQDIIVYRPDNTDPKPYPLDNDFDPISNDSPWIFEDSNRRKITPSELRVRSAEQLWRARNEIYARHGYIFQTDRGKAYSRQLGNNYTPQSGDSGAVERSFNVVEQYNIALVKSFESSRPNPVGPTPGSKWIFADSSARRLNTSEVQLLDKDKLWRARNEIFARNGYIFQTAKGKAFADSMGALYTPISSNMDKVYGNFNSIEVFNVALIKKYE